jgi:hypothetical protein
MLFQSKNRAYLGFAEDLMREGKGAGPVDLRPLPLSDS